MKATLHIELKPFQTPNFVLAESYGEAKDTSPEPQSFPLSALDSETLDRLCNAFRNEVFRKAGKEQPPTCEVRT